MFYISFKCFFCNADYFPAVSLTVCSETFKTVLENDVVVVDDDDGGDDDDDDDDDDDEFD